jgi:hypothetical protein
MMSLNSPLLAINSKRIILVVKHNHRENRLASSWRVLEFSASENSKRHLLLLRLLLDTEDLKRT